MVKDLVMITGGFSKLEAVSGYYLLPITILPCQEKVLFIDLVESEEQSVDSFMELPVQLMDLEPLVEGVELEEVEMSTESYECRGMVDKRLNNEGI